jgi:catechol 2,3-dioxygenase-like lactoylglutathione lyase family enzyme
MKGLLHHVELYVNDLDKSIAFWDWLLKDLDYEVYQKWDMGISYKNGPTYLVFVQVEERFIDDVYHRCKHGLNHLAFTSETNAFVDEMTQKLKEKGVRILYEDKHPYASGKDYYAVFFEDPDRMKVEIVSMEK